MKTWCAKRALNHRLKKCVTPVCEDVVRRQLTSHGHDGDGGVKGVTLNCPAVLGEL